MTNLKKILVANRGEIAIRVMRAAAELGKKTVAIYAEEDKLSLHRFKSDEAYRVGAGFGPVKAYLDIEGIIHIAKECGADAIHPGYGLLSENPDFADACAAAGIVFIGPKSDTMRLLGDKVSARNAAVEAGVPVVPATEVLPEDAKTIHALAVEMGFPLMLKASWGGGGRGMRPIYSEEELIKEVESGRREAEAAFGNGEVYLEKLVERARHVEVQILGDRHGNIVHLFERDCTVQRRNQKVVERAPAPYLDDKKRAELCDYALKLCRHAQYQCAGTVEFLMDADSDSFYFIEVNPRVQVEHTVTEEVTGIDIVKAQIRICEGGHIGKSLETGVPEQEEIKLNGNALQCRITTEDPQNKFIPDYGRISAYRGATGFGIRLDGGTAYTGAVITRYYDSLLEKVTAWAPTADEAIRRMDRALREFRIRGVSTNLAFVENLIEHPVFQEASYTTRFIDTHPELFDFGKRRDRATRLLTYIADVTVNGHPEASTRARPIDKPKPSSLVEICDDAIPDGSRTLLQQHGPQAVVDWIKRQEQVLLTDTTMRDAHQSLLATRMRTSDMVTIAPEYAHKLSGLFSMECWGGATFDVAMRFLNECPWERLHAITQAMPNIMTQMLLRASNGVGYTNYPDNAVRQFTRQAAESGVDVFRVFDSLNWVDNMRVAMDAVLESGKICEAAICYTGDMLDPNQQKYTLDYYVDMARQLTDAGAHILAIKDMAGLVRPEAAQRLITAIKEETDVPIHFHTHDTSGGQMATLLAAINAGVDIVDVAMDALSGLTSQPTMGSLVEQLKYHDRATGFERETISHISTYWEEVRHQYAGFETDMRSSASEVYMHEMPGGQFTNLKAQARSLNLSHRWSEVAKTYADVNQMFGDIVKVTPSSKVVGDMALAMVSAGLSREDVEDANTEVSFPESVVSFFKGELGQPVGGFPEALQKKVLKDEKPLSKRPGELLADADLPAMRAQLEDEIGRVVNDEDFVSYIMYPKVFVDFEKKRQKYGPVSHLDTFTYFYGMEPMDEITVDLERGKTLNIRLLAIGEVDEEGKVKVFYELNGQPRSVRVDHAASAGQVESRPQADADNENHVAAPMPGLVASMVVETGQEVAKGDLLLTLEAMKMETSIYADKAGTVSKVYVNAGSQVDTKDLLIELE